QGAGKTAKTGSPGTPGTTTVAVAGATGYTGQELLRILARHPAVQIAAAPSSGATAAGTSMRKLPALARIWNGSVTPLDRDALARDAEVVFLALADSAGAGRGPARGGPRGRRHPHRSGGCVPAAGRRQAGALVSGHAPAAERRRLRAHRTRAGIGRQRA